MKWLRRAKPREIVIDEEEAEMLIHSLAIVGALEHESIREGRFSESILEHKKQMTPKRDRLLSKIADALHEQ